MLDIGIDSKNVQNKAISVALKAITIIITIKKGKTKENTKK